MNTLGLPAVYKDVWICADTRERTHPTNGDLRLVRRQLCMTMPWEVLEALGSVRNVSALGYAALKTGSECSFTPRKLRFLASFRLA